MDSLRNPIKLEFSLHQLSMTAFVTSIYEHPDIKEKMKGIILTSDSLPFKNFRSETFPFKILKSELNKWVVEKLEGLNLPGKLMKEIQAMVLLFTNKIISWAYHVRYHIELDISYLDVIYWTSIGTIDEANIFDAYWKKHGSLDKILKNDTQSRIKGPELACIYTNEEVVLTFQNSMIKEILQYFKGNKRRFPKNKIKDDAIELMATYLFYKYGQEYDDTNDSEVCIRFIYNKYVDLGDLMYVCAYKNFVKPIKYFWDFLSDSTAKNIVDIVGFINFYGGACSLISSEEGIFDEIDGANSAELMYFLISVLTPDQRKSFFKLNIRELMECFLTVWPYQELCLKILDEEWISEIRSGDCKGILSATLFRMMADSQSGSCVYQNVFYDILKKVMKIVVKNEKEDIFFGEDYWPSPYKNASRSIEKFYERFDVTALSIIINDEDLEDKRNVMIEMGSDKIWELKKDNKLELLMSFMEEVLTSNEERKRFIENFKLLDNFLVADKPEIREKVLNWQSV